jgi:hypothetical protein
MKRKLLGLAGTIFLLVGLFIAYNRYSFFHNAACSVDGTVKEVIEKKRHKGAKIKYSYVPVFEYIAQNGNTYTYTSDLATNPPQYQVGEKVKLYYNPENPQIAKAYSILDSLIIPLVFILFGLFFIIISIRIKN